MSILKIMKKKVKFEKKNWIAETTLLHNQLITENIISADGFFKILIPSYSICEKHILLVYCPI